MGHKHAGEPSFWSDYSGKIGFGHTAEDCPGSLQIHRECQIATDSYGDLSWQARIWLFRVFHSFGYTDRRGATEFVIMVAKRS